MEQTALEKAAKDYREAVAEESRFKSDVLACTNQLTEAERALAGAAQRTSEARAHLLSSVVGGP